jgi:site-specific recombinase XerD
MLSLWRRHTKSCRFRVQGRAYTKCHCPVWVDGEVSGKRIRESLDTRDWARGGRKAATLESEVAEGRKRKKVAVATAAFLEQCSVESSTFKKYARIMGFLADVAKAKAFEHVDELDLEFLDAYRSGRGVCPLTWQKELQILRSFFGFCMDRQWIADNPARKMKMPSDPKPKERVPYTSEEITKIIAACDSFGRHAYERLRARAMILLMRFYGLRVSDVATLERDRVKGNQIYLHALKNGQAIWLPLYAEVWMALECLPIPRGAEADCKYFFWTGAGSRDGHIKTVDETLKSVFTKSGVEHAHAHRFRHTLTTEILVKGGTIEDAANILGDSPAVIRRYYAKWSVAYQSRTVEILQRVHGTSVAHTESTFRSPAFSIVGLVPEVGLEPTRPVKCAGF